MANFIQSYLEGKAKSADIDDWVDKWHEEYADNPSQSNQTLQEYLGMNDEEYSNWIKYPSQLEWILFSRVTSTLFGRNL